MIMSVWGVVFLGLLGLFFYTNAVTLFPDLGFEENEQLTRKWVILVRLFSDLFFRAVEEKYSEKAVQCWIAAGMYLVTLIVVFWQNKFNTAQVF